MMSPMEILGSFLVGMIFTYIGFAIFLWIWWKSCSWLFIWFVKVSEKNFKKNSWQEKLFLGTFVGFGGVASIYLFVYIFAIILKENGF